MNRLQAEVPGRHAPTTSPSTRRSSSASRSRRCVITLLIAIALVVLVIFLFLQDWRTTLIPSLTIPISLLGTFFLMKVLGFSINTLTLFGLTLATGLVVDDAIVVIENIARFIQEKGMAPFEGAREAMAEIFGRRPRVVAGPAGRLRPGRVLPGDDRTALQAVRADDRLRDHDLALQRADADAGALVDFPREHQGREEVAVLPAGQPSRSTPRGAPITAGCRTCCGVRGSRSRASRCCSRSRRCSSSRRRRVSSPTRIKATSSSARKARKASSIDYTHRAQRMLESDPADGSRRSSTSSTSPASASPERGSNKILDVRAAQTVERARGLAAYAQRNLGASGSAAVPQPDGHSGVRGQPAGHPRTRLPRRLRFRTRGSQRARDSGRCWAPPTRSSVRPTRRTAASPASTRCSPTTRRSSTSTSTATRRRASASTSPTSTTRCRSTWGRCT